MDDEQVYMPDFYEYSIRSREKLPSRIRIKNVGATMPTIGGSTALLLKEQHSTQQDLLHR